jgi:ParB-like nuclease domain
MIHTLITNSLDTFVKYSYFNTMQSEQELNQIEYIAIEKLHGYPNNPKTITKEDLKLLCDSIDQDKTYINSNPLKCYIEDSKIIVYGGNQRLLACKTLGFEVVPVIIDRDCTPEQAKARVLKDNLQYGKYDKTLLEQNWTIEELQEFAPIEDFDGVFTINELEVAEVKEEAISYNYERFSFATPSELGLNAKMKELKTKYTLNSFSNVFIKLVTEACQD